MASELIKQLRKARQSTMDLDGFTFTYRRPTDLEMLTKVRTMTHANIAESFVIGWKGVKESDLVPSGASKEAEFDPELWAEWLADHPNWWAPIGEKIVGEWTRHNELREAAAKN